MRACLLRLRLCAVARPARQRRDKDKAIVLGQPPCQRGYRSGLHVKVLWYAVEYIQTGGGVGYCMKDACMHDE